MKTIEYTGKNYDKISLILYFLGLLIFGFLSIYLYLFFYLKHGVYLNIASICLVFALYLAIPILQVVLDKYSKIKTGKYKIISKSAYFPRIRRHGPIFNLRIDKSVEQNIDLNHGKYWIRVRGIWGKLMITREMFASVKKGEEVEIEYYPYTKYIKKITISDEQFVSSSDLRIEEIKSHNWTTLWKLIYGFGTIIGIGLFIKFTSTPTDIAFSEAYSREVKYKQVETTPNDINQFLALLSENRKGDPNNLVILNHTKKLVEGRYTEGQDTFNFVLKKKGSNRWYILAAYAKPDISLCSKLQIHDLPETFEAMKSCQSLIPNDSNQIK